MTDSEENHQSIFKMIGILLLVFIIVVALRLIAIISLSGNLPDEGEYHCQKIDTYDHEDDGGENSLTFADGTTSLFCDHSGNYFLTIAHDQDLGRLEKGYYEYIR